MVETQKTKKNPNCEQSVMGETLLKDKVTELWLVEFRGDTD